MSTPFENARLHHQRGELAQAIQAYGALLDAEPARADVWHLKGLAEHQSGQLEAALRSVERAIAAGGERPQYLLLQGHVLQDRGELAGAQDCFARLVAIRPDWAPGHVALGSACMDRGDLAGAIAAFRAATGSDPRHPRAWQNLGVALQASGALDDAAEAFGRALAIEPSYALAHLNLARLFNTRDAAKALAHAEAASRLDPRLADAWLLAGDIHRRAFRFEQAFAAFNAAASNAPQDLRAGIAKADLLAELGRIDESRAEFATLSQRFPGSLKAALGAELQLPRVYASAEQLDESRARYMRGLEALDEAAGRFRYTRAEAALADARWVNFYLAYQGRDDRVLQERYAGIIRRVLEPHLPRFFEPRRRPAPRDRLRIGFLSHFFFNCVVGRYFASWITHLDRSRFDPYVYYTNEWVADDTRTIAAASREFRHLAGKPLHAIADQVIADDLDVLVYPELGMHPDIFALAQLRLAPVQCAGWGHPTTTGIPEIDWFISCEGMEPEGAQAHYRERLALLPGLGTRYAIPRADAGATRADYGLPEDRTLYFVPQSLFKIHPDNDDLIAEVLARDPAGIAVMFPSKQERFTQVFSERFSRALARKGLTLEGRVRFLEFTQHAKYLRINELCDVMLDTLHWSGGNTSLDALAAGLPLVTLPGAFMRGRQSAAMLGQMGLAELIAEDRDAYVEKALELGADRERRREVSARIAANRGALFERDEPVRAFGDFLVRAAGETR
jgi:protein O-GlcNAc transferase